MKNVISFDENGDLVYDWAAIDRAAAKQAVDREVLSDFAFDNITEEMTAERLVDAYKTWLEAEKEFQS
jgi:hypothetical protein